ncbi:MAG: hypothetical protein C0402_02870 [Thermodesulfovibrio sp.]|nr:hypothetical protein [Thermodesulfovibrio sp.]
MGPVADRPLRRADEGPQGIYSMTVTKKDLWNIYQNGLSLTSAKSLQSVLAATLEKALLLTEVPAGSIALRERNEMIMAAAAGFSSSINDLTRWKLRDGGLTAHIMSCREIVEIPDLSKETRFDGRPLLDAGVRALLACPLRLNGDIVGILYLDDFRPRKFAERHKDLILLFAMQAAQAIDKFRILDELYRVIGDLDEKTAYLKNVLDDSQDMIMTTDSDGTIVEISRGGERILGYHRDEIIGLQAAGFYLDPEERSRIVEVLKNRNAVYNYETRLLRKDGSPVDINLTISQLRNTTGRVIGTVGVSKDITEAKKLRDELRIMNNELKELNMRLEDKVIERTRDLEKSNTELIKSNQIKARFISNMSHELRTPLNSILGFSEILLEKTFGDLNDKQSRHVTNISSSGKHLLQLVNNILDLAKIEAGKIDLFYEDFDVQQALSEVSMIMNSLAARKNIQIQTDISAETGTFHADKVKFKQILYNLISNAIKFTPAGGELGITVASLENRASLLPWALEGQQFLQVTVWDKGIGIKPEDTERIFEEFEQADSTMARNFEGTGLGLALTKKLIDLHGGQITLRSVYGEGSEFTFYLPRINADETNMETEEFMPLRDAFPWLTEEAPLVLVVEDDLPTSEILTIHITKAGYRVVHAYDGVEAIAKAKELRPFLITLDVMLPRKDGWEVLQTLKADPETGTIPVIIHSMIDNKDLAFALGASDYLLKPIDKTALLSKMSELALSTRRSNLPTSILLISSDAEMQEQIHKMSITNGFLFDTAHGQAEGLERAAVTKPHIIMIDLSTSGFGAINAIRNNAATMDIPVFALTNKDLSITERQDLTGQIERILKKDALTENDLVRHLKDLEVLHPRRAGLVDELTGLFNHRYLQLRLAQEVSRALRYRNPLTLLLLDVDNFGHYVQHKGQYHGNLVLKKIADLIQRSIRGSDVLVRNGGDAFSVILSNTSLASGITLGKRFNAIIADYPFLFEEIQSRGKITVSVGIASLQDQSTEELMRCAETALSVALQKGGNMVEVFENAGQ